MIVKADKFHQRGIKAFLARIMLVIVTTILSVQSVIASEQAEATESTLPLQQTRSPADRAATRHSVDPGKRALQSLASAVPEDQLLWLEGGEFDPEAVMALYLPAKQSAGTRRARLNGGVVLLHGFGQHPDWPDITGYLRKNLPDYGWHTLSLAMVYQHNHQQPERKLLPRSAAEFPMADAIPRIDLAGVAANAAGDGAQLDDSAAVQADEDSIGASPADFELPSEVDIDARGNPETATMSEEFNNAATPLEEASEPAITNARRVAIGLQHLQSKDIENQVIIGVGEGAQQIMLYLLEASAGSSMPSGIVLINAQFGASMLRQLNTSVPGWSSVKVLDVYDSTHPALTKVAFQRRDFARQIGSGMRPDSYQASPIPGLTVLPGGASSRLLSRIRSWQQRVLVPVAR